MALTPREIAEAFSHHEFARTYGHLAADVRWDHVGGEVRAGRAAVISACDHSAAALAVVRTTFRSSRTLVAGDTVVVETAADYVDGGVTTTVGSCDRYDFVDGAIAAITSYAVALP